MSRFTLTAFADEIGADLDLQLSELNRHDIHYVEFRGADGKGIADYTLQEARQAKRRMDAAGVKVSAVGSPMGKIGIEEDFFEHLKTFYKIIDIAQIFQTPYIRMFSFFIPRGKDPFAYRGEVMRRLSAFTQAVKGTGITLLHENEKEIYGDVPNRCKDIFDTLACEQLWMTYDPSNFVQCGVKNYPDAFNLLRPYIRYMHIKDSVFTGRKAQRDTGFDTITDAHRPAGYGDGDLKRIVTALYEDGYEGFFSIEPHLSHNDAIPGSGADKFAVAVKAIKDLIAQVEAEHAPAQQ
ncbi:MAG: sugar phosphate isomerase/epimerase family protein [Christensenellales bacterium]|jgi:sugar phosphate isomerase/epimerase